jgi:hypothetical protein
VPGFQFDQQRRSWQAFGRRLNYRFLKFQPQNLFTWCLHSCLLFRPQEDLLVARLYPASVRPLARIASFSMV